MARKKSGANAATAVPMPYRERESVSVRKIDNGFIVTHTSCGKDGGYRETECFSPKKPDLRIAKLAKR
jgi:hypothetical protein